jgi:UDP-N-acetylmuramate--alanine ligase
MAGGSQRSVHLVGVAGVGMSSLAQALAAEGWRVSGSDRYADGGRDLEVIRKLRAAGVAIVPQDGQGVAADTAAVVVSTAIESDNPDLAAAQRLGVPVRHRAEMLAELLEGKRSIAITGTCGKTTVTGLVGWVLTALGLDPTVVNGGAVVNWATDRAVGNFRAGRSGWWVIEADESDRSLLRFRPEWAVITNASADHFGLPETLALFESFRAQVRRGVVSGLDAAGAAPAGVRLGADGGRFTYAGREFHVPLLGAHNVENAWHALRLCEALGLDLARAGAALARFGGIQRRLERVGEAGGVIVVDDYAHNPAKIAAALAAVKPYYRRVVAVWRPHGFGPLRQMLDDLVAVFAEAAAQGVVVHLLPVYYAGGTANRAVDTDQLVERLRARGAAARLAASYEELGARIGAEAREGDVVLSMGARDPDLPLFARALVAGLQPSGRRRTGTAPRRAGPR